MDLNELLMKLEKLNKEASAEDCDLEKLENELDELKVENLDFLYDKKNKRGRLFVCPDIEGDFPYVYEIAEEYFPEVMDIIYDATTFHYRTNQYLKIVSTFGRNDMVKVFLRLNNIPIIRFFNITEVDVLNNYKLRKECWKYL